MLSKLISCKCLLIFLLSTSLIILFAGCTGGDDGTTTSNVSDTNGYQEPAQHARTDVPHVIEGRGDCHACHGSFVMWPMSDTHEGRTNETCLDCHDGINNPTHRGADCITCHMSYVTKTAVTTNKYVADMKTHIFKINPAADGKMFNDEGTIANGETGVTLNYVCYQCHRDPSGVGGGNSYKTMEELSARATGFHD